MDSGFRRNDGFWTFDEFIKLRFLKIHLPPTLKQTFLIGPSAVSTTSPTERPGMRAGG
jgi:hypothetical protein